MKRRVLILAGVVSLALPAVAAPMTYELPAETARLRPAPGPGREAAANNCGACHSADYIAIQPPNRGRPFWDAEVTKMINVYKAKISPEDAAAIAAYLAERY